MTISKLGRYDIIRVLGKGAMGLVYEARDPNLDRRVAIKTIKVENLSAEASADYEARFRTEARSAARLQHPNIVSVYDSEPHGDVAYLVMEYVQGEDLKQHLDGGKLYSLEQSLAMLRDLLAALDYAHRQNIVHRDVKPANLLVEASGRVKLTDFGVARIQDSGEATRTKGSMVGTLKYMSPEQVQGQSVDARADLFAAGVVLYQLLTGKRPFDGDSEFAIIHQIVSQNPPAPSTINPQLPPALDAVVARALAKQREQRFASAQDFALALQEASGQVADPTIVPPPGPREARGGSSTGSGASRSRTGGSTAGLVSAGDGSGSSVTQELELVYWKDVKESDDPEELQGFMDRFPGGIYYDLARRRLKKLVDRERGENSATLAATMALPAGAAAAPSGAAHDATLVQARSDPVPARQAVAGVPPAGQDAPVQAAPAAQPLAAPLAGAHTSPARRSKAPMFAAIAAVVVVAAGIAIKLSSGGPAPGVDTGSVPAASAPSASPQAAPAAPASASADVALAAAPTPVASAAAAAPLPAKAPLRPASAATDKALPRAPTAKSALAEMPAATPAPMPTPAPVARSAPAKSMQDAPVVAPALAANPAQACEGRVLLGFQACLNEQCAKPAFANAAVCVERRAAEKNRNNQQRNERN